MEHLRENFYAWGREAAMRSAVRFAEIYPEELRRLPKLLEEALKRHDERSTK